ncbi:MAG: DUF2892 domain-containing protein [Rhodospirillaceae bacterium]|nr:DUF2892 domain-containing protein [Rhodospirillaceae bacterium]
MKKNLAMIERVLRVVLGGTLAVWALVLFFGGAGFMWRLLYVALLLLSAELMIAGTRGYCAIYNRLGWSTAQRNTNTQV